jgi:hypothetical protein
MVGYGTNKGIVPISCDEIFKRIEREKNDNSDKYQFQVTIQMLEIYNEQVGRKNSKNRKKRSAKGGEKKDRAGRASQTMRKSYSVV